MKKNKDNKEKKSFGIVKNVYDVFKTGCMIFTFVVFSFYILGEIMSNTVKFLTLNTLSLLFLFSIWFAISNLLFKSKKLNLIIKVTLHYISTVIGFFVIFVWIPGNIENNSRAFLLTLVFSALYILVACAVLGIKFSVNRKNNEKSDYSSVYDNPKE